MNEHEEIHIPWSTVVLLTLLMLTTLGWVVSPRNQQGRPLILMPDVKSVEEYRRLAERTSQELKLVDGELSGILGGDSSDLFGQTRSAQRSLEHILKVVQDVDRHEAPPALVGFRDELNHVSLTYLEAARQTLRWLSVPNTENSELAILKLNEAGAGLDELENSQWLQMKSR